ncbi:MFS general substrate transporter [Aspergillus heteromorphus CBS 117.55]|uniref:MFS general substrate transporter n=1 Tax=Aspergillus heteromorphus CBS 117.55 TaxID=1448321 RepID=A0A317VIZ0_9EURO|nr:MFS general substrate transporter [Aspergillus heteromorphus CBS 117.55]PWY74344.1 MFS general substrate transporter [Aspergillus heteromorphus CBS 117.55]
MLPVLVISYMLQYLDKATMSNAAILGLRTDLHLTGSEYSWASSIFYFGYLAASGPIALLIVRFPIGKFMAVSVAVWAAVLCCMAATHNAAGLLATRFFLGFAEAAVAPGFSIITSMWYLRSEQPVRHGVWFLGNVISGLFSGPLMYAFGHVHSFPPWRLVFIVFGAITFVWGICLIFLLPDSPAQAWFLSDVDKVSAVNRLKEDITGTKHSKWKKEQMFEALRDPKAWLAVLIMLCANIPNGGISSFASIVIEGMGFSTDKTFLVSMIVTGFQGFFVVVSTLGSTYLPNTRTIWMTICSAIALVGAVVIRQVDNSHIWARYSGYCLLSAYTANFPLLLSLNASNIAGITKKTTVNAMCFIAYCTGNIIGPQLFFADQAPSYPSGFAGMMVCLVLDIGFILAMRGYLTWENKRRRARMPVGQEQDDVADLYLLDRTDGEMEGYQYVY